MKSVHAIVLLLFLLVAGIGCGSDPLVEPEALTQLESEDPFVRRTAIRALENEDEEILPILIEILETDSDAGVRVQVIRTLSTIGEAALPVVLAASSDEDTIVRRQVATVLAGFTSQPEDVVAALIDLLDDAESSVREAAASSLGSHADFATEALPALAVLLGDPVFRVQMSAERAIVQIDSDFDPVPILMAGLEDKRTENMKRAGRALLNFDFPFEAARPTLEQALLHEDAEMQSIVIRLFSQAGDEVIASLPVLLSAVSQIESNLVQSLQRIVIRSAEESYPLIKAAYLDDEENLALRRMALDTLLYWDTDLTLGTLIQGLDANCLYIRTITARRLLESSVLEEDVQARVAAVAAEPLTFFVATNGSDSWSGLLDQPNKERTDGPVATIQRAVNSMSPGDRTYVRQGTYQQRVNLHRSGTAEQPIVLTNYPGEKVVLDGSRIIEADWQVWQGKIYRANVSSVGEQLFANGQALVEARWPNVEYDQDRWPIIDQSGWSRMDAGSVYGHIVDPNLAKLEFDLDGAKIGLINNWLYWDGIEVLGHDGESLDYAKSLGAHVDQTGRARMSWEDQYYFLHGHLDLLDHPGEYYHDSNQGVLYVWMPSGESPEQYLLQTSDESYLITGNRLEYVEVSGLHLFSASIRLTQANHVLVRDVHLHYPDRELELNGYSNRLENFSAGFVLRSAVSLIGEGSTITNSVVHDVYSKQGHTIFIAPESKGMMVEQSTIFNLARKAIRAKSAPETLVTRNHIFDAGYLRGETSTVITGNFDAAGTVFSYNWVHGVHCWGKGNAIGLRADDSSRQITMHHNVIWNVTNGIVAKGDGHQIYNNTLFANSRSDLVIPERPEPPLPGFIGQGREYLDTQNLNSIVYNNAAIRIADWANNPYRPPGGSLSNNHRQPNFHLKDIDNYDFRPQPWSPLVNSGDQSGIGAYNMNDEYWIPGATNGVRVNSRLDGDTLSLSLSLLLPPLEEATLAVDIAGGEPMHQLVFNTRNWYQPQQIEFEQIPNVSDALQASFVSTVLGAATAQINSGYQEVEFDRPMLPGSAPDFGERGLLQHVDGKFTFLTDEALNIPMSQLGAVMIPNMSFEAASNGIVENWSFNPSTAEANAQGRQDSSEAFDGQHSVIIEVPATESGRFWPQWNTEIDLESLPLNAGDDYIFSVWVKTRDMITRANLVTGVRFVLDFYATSGSRIARHQMEPAMQGNHDWFPLIYTGTVPDGAERLEVSLMLAQTGGNVWFDYVQLQSAQYTSWRDIIRSWNQEDQ